MLVKIQCQCGKEIEINPASLLGKHSASKLTPKQRTNRARKAGQATKKAWSDYKRKIKIRK